MNHPLSRNQEYKAWLQHAAIAKQPASQLRQCVERDAPTIGILLCKHKHKLVAEYALSDIQKPMGVSEYQLTQSLPTYLQSDLPSIEEIESELGGEG